METSIRRRTSEFDVTLSTNGRGLREFRLEAFRIEGSSVVTVLDMADSNGEYEEFASDTLWQDLNTHLNQLSSMQ